MESITSAMRKVRARTLIVTLGELGALVKDREVIQLTPALSALVKEPVDVTGAGDVWCGAFLTSYIKTLDLHKSTSIASILAAIKCRGWNFERIVSLKLKDVDEALNLVISSIEGYHRLTEWIKDREEE